MIAFENFSCHFGNRLVLDNISAQLTAGCVALIGPNGAGKSTLLTACADGGRHWQQARRQGRATLSAEDFSPLPLNEYPLDELAKRRAFLPQHHADSITLAVADLLVLAGWPHGRTALRDEPLFTDAVQRWELASLLPRRYSSLSGGERQRTQLARTWLQMRLCENPSERLWLLDEPQNALDLPHQQKLRHTLKAEGASGALVLFSTHDLNFALRSAHHFLFLREGRLLAQGGTELMQDTALLDAVFGVGFDCLAHPADGLPWLLPH